MKKRFFLFLGVEIALMMLFSPLIVRATTDYVGTEVNHYSLASTYVQGFKITASASGTLTTLGIKLYNPVGNTMLALYSDNSGNPQTLLCAHNEQTSVSDWNYFDVSNCSLSIVQGTTYWIGYMQSDNSQAPYVTNAGNSRCGRTNPYGTFPEPYGSCSISSDGGEGLMTYALPSYPPLYFTNTSSVPSIYNGTSSIFNVTWKNITDMMQNSLIEINSVNNTMTLISRNSTFSNYGYSVIQAAGDYSFRFIGNTTANKQNATDMLSYTINSNVTYGNYVLFTNPYAPFGVIGYTYGIDNPQTLSSCGTTISSNSFYSLSHNISAGNNICINMNHVHNTTIALFGYEINGENALRINDSTDILIIGGTINGESDSGFPTYNQFGTSIQLLGCAINNAPYGNKILFSNIHFVSEAGAITGGSQNCDLEIINSTMSANYDSSDVVQLNGNGIKFFNLAMQSNSGTYPFHLINSNYMFGSNLTFGGIHIDNSSHNNLICNSIFNYTSINVTNNNTVTSSSANCPQVIFTATPEYTNTTRNIVKTTLVGFCSVFYTGNNYNQTLSCMTSPIDTSSCSVIESVTGRFHTGYDLTSANFNNIISNNTCSYYNTTKNYVFNTSGYFVNPTLSMCTDILLGYGMPTVEMFSNYPLYANNHSIRATCSQTNTNLNVSINSIACEEFVECAYNITATCSHYCFNGNIYTGGVRDANGYCVNSTISQNCVYGCGSPTSCAGGLIIPNPTNPVEIQSFSNEIVSWVFSGEGFAFIITTMIATFVGASLPTKEFNYKLYAFGFIFLGIMTIGILFGYISAWFIVLPVLVLAIIGRKFIMSLLKAG